MSLVRRLAQQELQWQGRSMLAPVVAPGRAVVRLEGLVHEVTTEPKDFTGLAVFEMIAEGRARWVRQASPKEREGYLKLWPRSRARLLERLQCGAWLAWGEQGLFCLFGLERGQPLELVEWSRCGQVPWFFRAVLNTRLALAEEMRLALEAHLPPQDLRLPTLTPLDRLAYAALWKPPAKSPQDLDRERLEQALARGGGRLRQFSRAGDELEVEWQDGSGGRYRSRLRRRDLSVVSSGICLSGRDLDFDLTSLVGVVEGA